MNHKPTGKRFVVRAGIPIPPMFNPRKPGKSKYPLARMKIGDSFGLPKTMRVALRAAVKASRESRPETKKWRFTIRPYKGAYRCWRVK